MINWDLSVQTITYWQLQCKLWARRRYRPRSPPSPTMPCVRTVKIQVQPQTQMMDFIQKVMGFHTDGIAAIEICGPTKPVALVFVNWRMRSPAKLASWPWADMPRTFMPREFPLETETDAGTVAPRNTQRFRNTGRISEDCRPNTIKIAGPQGMIERLLQCDYISRSTPRSPACR